MNGATFKKMSLEKVLFDFLDLHYNQHHPVLLGLSGGPDSLALFYLLNAYQQNRSFQFGVAHIDHCWREESGQEAASLSRLADDKKVKFHLKKLNPHCLSGNLEAACREERLSFFSQLCKEYGYQAVILGHHADDQSETILKKILEGSSLLYLQGMRTVSSYRSLKIWRPLLNTSKSEIYRWLKQEGHFPFEDKTNLDERFLRARLRAKIIPGLSQEFGKEVSKSLQRVGLESEELKKYLEGQLATYAHSILSGPWGSCLDLSENCPKTAFELRYLIRKVLEGEGIRVSYSLIDQACQKIQSKASNCRLLAKNAFIFFDRGRLFVSKEPIAPFDQEIPLNLGKSHYLGWHLNVEENLGAPIESSGWKEAWQGRFQVLMPEGTYFLKKGNASISKWWTNHKVPAFMREIFPVIWSKKRIEHEFLTKRRILNSALNAHKTWRISISYDK